MSAISPEVALRQRAGARNPFGPLGTLARRRFQLTASRPRELFVPLVTPILFALVIAPALKTALHTTVSYEAFVATGTIGPLIPLNTMFSGLSVIVDRQAGAQRELLSAPIPRTLLPIGNLLVALATTGFQIAVLLGVAEARRIHFHITAGGFLWFLGASLFFASGMYGLAEVLAARVPKAEEYIARVPAVAIVPWFLAGSLFSIKAMPVGLTWITRFLPLTHGLALVRYGLLDDPTALHDIWGMHSTGAMAGLSLLVVAAFAVLLTRAATRVFSRSAIQ
jgi:ABC-2 type transport system permease protein